MLTSTVRGLATVTVTSTTIVAIADHAVEDSSPYYRLLPGNEPVWRAAAEEISVRACSVAVVVSRVRRSPEEPARPALVEEAPGPSVPHTPNNCLGVPPAGVLVDLY